MMTGEWTDLESVVENEHDYAVHVIGDVCSEARCERYARGYEYLISGEKGVEDAKEWQFVFVLRKTNLWCAMYGVSTEFQPQWMVGEKEDLLKRFPSLEGQTCYNQTNRRTRQNAPRCPQSSCRRRRFFPLGVQCHQHMN
jgi:hypothetical protein